MTKKVTYFRLILARPHNIYTCPCCHGLFYDNIQSIDDAILIGEAATLFKHITPQLFSVRGTVMAGDLIRIHEMNKLVIEKLELGLQSNPTNFDIMHSLNVSCSDGAFCLESHDEINFPSKFYRLRLFDYSLRILDHPAISVGPETVKTDCYHHLAEIFSEYHNYSASFKYAKLAYEHCVRSTEHRDLSSHSRALYLKSRTDFAKLSKLRFAVGDEVEFLHELETGSEWKRAKVLELYYWEPGFDKNFSAPYRLQLLDVSADQPPVHAWVKADLDRYVRKVGVRSIEETRYQARLDAKIAEFAEVYCTMEFIRNIYRILAQDREFVEMLRSVWQIDLSESTVKLYCMYILDRQPFIRTDSGYHVPSSEEIIAGIRAYLDPSHLSSDVSLAVGEDRYSLQVRAEILSKLRSTRIGAPRKIEDSDIQGHLVQSIGAFGILSRPGLSGLTNAHVDGGEFTVPSDMSEALSKATTVQDIMLIQSRFLGLTKLGFLLVAWIEVQMCLQSPNAGPACECPFVYFFVKYCLDRSWGIPKLALALYDRMNMQLSRAFIRCANPTCELNKLDKSTGKVKFKQCSRCKAVIYCSRECQVAHFPDHKRLCREHATG